MENIDEIVSRAENGDVEALLWLGNYHLNRDEEQEALVCFKKAAQIGSANAVFNLGLIYYMGLKTVPNDFEKAAFYFQFLVNNGIEDAEVYHLLGRCYALKKEKDLDLALEFFKKAAKMGNEMAAKDRDALLYGGQIMETVY